jgi:DHA3 family tetracycline resistance protein-like MFS transporter
VIQPVTVVAGLLSLAFLRLPMLVSAVGFLFLAVSVWLLMPEEHFRPTPVQRRKTFRHLARYRPAQVAAGPLAARAPADCC